MNSSVQGPDRIGLTGCQSAPSLGFDSIPPWRMGKVGKGVSTFPRGRCIVRNDLGEVLAVHIVQHRRTISSVEKGELICALILVATSGKPV